MVQYFAVLFFFLPLLLFSFYRNEFITRTLAYFFFQVAFFLCEWNFVFCLHQYLVDEQRETKISNQKKQTEETICLEFFAYAI